MGITEQLFEKTMAKDSLLSTIFIYTTEVINASIMFLYTQLKLSMQALCFYIRN